MGSLPDRAHSKNRSIDTWVVSMGNADITNAAMPCGTVRGIDLSRSPCRGCEHLGTEREIDEAGDIIGRRHPCRYCAKLTAWQEADAAVMEAVVTEFSGYQHIERDYKSKRQIDGLTDDVIAGIKLMARQMCSLTQISKRYGIDLPTINSVLREADGDNLNFRDYAAKRCRYVALNGNRCGEPGHGIGGLCKKHEKRFFEYNQRSFAAWGTELTLEAWLAERAGKTVGRCWSCGEPARTTQGRVARNQICGQCMHDKIHEGQRRVMERNGGYLHKGKVGVQARV